MWRFVFVAGHLGLTYCGSALAREDAVRQKTNDTRQLEKDLEGRTREEVKEYFGRKPDDSGDSYWVYFGRFIEKDSEVVFERLHVMLPGDRCVGVVFHKKR